MPPRSTARRIALPSPKPSAPTSAEEQRVSSSDQIVREIMRGLYEGRYVPGQKLTESELTRRFSVGRGTVREALKRLAAEGLVTVSLHRGASIRALSREAALDMLQVIEVLASLAARLAAERDQSPENLKSLRDALKTLSSASSVADSFEFARLRNRFYRQLAQLSGNHELARLVPTVQAHLIRVQFRSAYGGVERRRAADYRRIVEAVLEKNGPKAERAMRAHVRATALTIEELPDDAFAF